MPKKPYLTQQTTRTLILIISTVVYMLLGAAVFSSLENSKHEEEKKKYLEIYKNLLNKYNMSRNDVEDLANYIHKRRHIKWGLDPWSFAGSVYFTSVTITTIGYGHSVPQTLNGKVFCMLYAVVGIPLNLTMFQAIGERMGVFMTFLLRRLKRAFRMKNTDISLIQLVAFGLFIWSAFLCLGAALFNHFERWNFYLSLYYFFVTLTTIGFGEMVALQEINNTETEGSQSPTLYIASTLIMIYIGLAIASSVINLLVIRLMELQHPRRKRKSITWKNSARCGNCRHRSVVGNAPNANGLSSPLPFTLMPSAAESSCMMILNNFEHEVTFTSYKQLNANNKKFPVTL